MAKKYVVETPEQKIKKYLEERGIHPSTGGSVKKADEDISEVKKDTGMQVLKDKEGRLSGITIKGKTYLGLSPKDVQTMAAREMAATTPPAGTIAPGTRAEQERLQRLTEQTGRLTPEQIAIEEAQAREAAPEAGLFGLPGNLNFRQALAAGGADAFLAAGVGAGGGAILGAPAAGVGAIPGAIIGGTVAGLGAFVRGVYTDLKQQQAGLVKAEGLNVDRAITNLNNVISARNLGADEVESQLLYNQIVADTYQAHAELKIQTQTQTGKAFDDGTKQLEKFEIFFREGGTLDTINAKMNQALINPNPTKVSSQTIQSYFTEEAEGS